MKLTYRNSDRRIVAMLPDDSSNSPSGTEYTTVSVNDATQLPGPSKYTESGEVEQLPPNLQ